jgi:hypothetical protein
MHLISLFLDLLLVVAGIVAFLARPQIGGELARGLRVVTIGVLVLGFGHLIETALFALFQFEPVFNEIVHRLIIAVGFVLIIAGFFTMRRAFDE